MRRNSPIYRQLVQFKTAIKRLVEITQTALDEEAADPPQSNKTLDDTIFEVFENKGKVFQDSPTKGELKLRKEALSRQYKSICAWMEESAVSSNKQALPDCLPPLPKQMICHAHIEHPLPNL